jgi:hypothetical protein
MVIVFPKTAQTSLAKVSSSEPCEEASRLFRVKPLEHVTFAPPLAPLTL